MTTATADKTPTESLADVTRALGIPRHVRQVLITQRLITPAEPVKKGQAVRITADDAALIRKAAGIAVDIAAVFVGGGYGLVMVLRVLRAEQKRDHQPPDGSTPVLAPGP